MLPFTRVVCFFPSPLIQWAYNAINPKLGAAKADVWRYAVMWCYGGFYMDYDSDFTVLLDDAILPTDTLLVAQVLTIVSSQQRYLLSLACLFTMTDMMTLHLSTAARLHTYSLYYYLRYNIWYYRRRCTACP